MRLYIYATSGELDAGRTTERMLAIARREERHALIGDALYGLRVDEFHISPLARKRIAQAFHIVEWTEHLATRAAPDTTVPSDIIKVTQP